MSKIKIRALVGSSLSKMQIETNAIYQEGILKYQEEDKTKVCFNMNCYSLTRENSQIKMYYTFKKGAETRGIIEIKEYNKKIFLKIATQKIKRKNNNIEISFKIENEEFLYKIEEII